MCGNNAANMAQCRVRVLDLMENSVMEFCRLQRVVGITIVCALVCALGPDASGQSNHLASALHDKAQRVAALQKDSAQMMQDAATDASIRSNALRLTQQLLLLDPRNDAVIFQLATLLAWNHQPADATKAIARLSAAAHQQIQVFVLACSTQAQLGNAALTTHAANALAAHPELTEQDASACLPALRAAHRADLIVHLYEAAARHQALSAQSKILLALAYEASGNPALARQILDASFSESSTQDPQLLVHLTRIAIAQGELQSALGYLAHARDLLPRDASLPYEFGILCTRLGLIGEARKAFHDAVAIDPENADFNYALGSVISLSQDSSQAIPYLEKFHSLMPQDPNGVLALGIANFRAKDYSTAEAWLTKASASAATASDACFYLGRIARQSGRMDEAIAQLNRALEAEANRAEILAELGQIYLQNRDNAQAVSYLDRALRIDPDNYAANFGLIQLYARTSDPRREAQAKHFAAIKDKKEEQDRLMRRVLAFDTAGESHHTAAFAPANNFSDSSKEKP